MTQQKLLLLLEETSIAILQKGSELSDGDLARFDLSHEEINQCAGILSKIVRLAKQRR